MPKLKAVKGWGPPIPPPPGEEPPPSKAHCPPTQRDRDVTQQRGPCLVAQGQGIRSLVTLTGCTGGTLLSASQHPESVQ